MGTGSRSFRDSVQCPYFSTPAFRLNLDAIPPLTEEWIGRHAETLFRHFGDFLPEFCQGARKGSNLTGHDDFTTPDHRFGPSWVQQNGEVTLDVKGGAMGIIICNINML